MRRFLLAAVVAVAGLLANNSSVNAAFKFRYSVNGAAFITVDDDAAGDLNNTVAGSIITNVSGVSVSATSTGFSTPVETFLDLAVTGTALATVDSIVAEATFTGALTQPPPQVLSYSFTGSISPSTKAGAVFQTWVNTSNTEFGTGPDTSGPGNIGDSGSFVFNDNNAYSVTTRITITRKPGETGVFTVSLDSLNTVVTPAPAGLLMALTAAPVFGFGAWIRRRRGM